MILFLSSMRKITFIFLIFSFFAQSQIKYDYALEYDYFEEKDTTHNHRVTYYMNSKSNDCFLAVRALDSSSYRLYFRDNSLFTLMIHMDKDEFEKADILNNNCIGVSKWYSELNRKIAKRYAFEAFEDTLINKKKMSFYKIVALPNVKRDKYKSQYNYFIVDDNYSKDLLLFESPHDYNLWQRDQPFFKGVIVEYGRHNRKYGYRKYKLVDVKKVKKVLQIPENCTQLN